MSPLSGISVIVGVGASGAIMGLAGATVVYILSVADNLRYKNRLITMIVLIVLSILSALQSDDEVMTDDVAHFSGLVSATAAGLLILLLVTCSSSCEPRLLYERETILKEIGIMIDAPAEKQLND